MLHRETIEPHTLELLKRIQGIPFFSKTRLVGGTALALQFGHRLSIDLDIFGIFDKNLDVINSYLEEFENVILRYSTPSIFAYLIDGVKVDLVNYPVDWIDDELIVEGVKMASDKDIAAMKLSAITGRGSKKDFVDLYLLLEKYSMSEIIEFYKKKYPDGNLFLVLRSLIYFEDADSQKVDMLRKIDWGEVKSTIIKKYNNYLNEEKLK